MGDTVEAETIKNNKNEKSEEDSFPELGEITVIPKIDAEKEIAEKPEQLESPRDEKMSPVVEDSRQPEIPEKEERKIEADDRQKEKTDLRAECDNDVSSPTSHSNEPKIDEEKNIVTEEIANDKTETILSSQSLKSSNPSIYITNDNTNNIPSLTTSSKNVQEKRLSRNQSDILPSLREIPRDEDPSLMIFSHKGLPTKKYFKRREVNSTILPFGFNEKNTTSTRDHPSPRNKAEAVLTPKISQTIPKLLKAEEGKCRNIPFKDRNPNLPTDPNPSISRNVLTGRGVNSQDEFKSRSTRRKGHNKK